MDPYPPEDDFGCELGNIVKAVALEGGWDSETIPFPAELDKLVLYEEGAALKGCNDAANVPGLFGKLQISLTSHKGGDIHMKKLQPMASYHNGYLCLSQRKRSYAWWYCDVPYEMRPIVDGYRLVLSYNLIQNDLTIPSWLMMPSDTRILEGMFDELERCRADGKASVLDYGQLAFPLSEAYQEHPQNESCLQGNDLRQLAAVKRACEKTGFHVYLGTLPQEGIYGPLLQTPPEIDDSVDYIAFIRDGQRPLLDESLILDTVYSLGGRLLRKNIPIDWSAVLNTNYFYPDGIDSKGSTSTEERPGGCMSRRSRTSVMVIVPPGDMNQFYRVQDIGRDGILSDDVHLLIDCLAEEYRTGKRGVFEEALRTACDRVVLTNVEYKHKGLGVFSNTVIWSAVNASLIMVDIPLLYKVVQAFPRDRPVEGIHSRRRRQLSRTASPF